VAWPPPWLEAPERSPADQSPERQSAPDADTSQARTVHGRSEELENVPAPPERSEEREQQSTARPREQGLRDGRKAGGGSNRLLPSEERAILDLINEWAPVDHSHRKLAHRGSYIGTVFVSPTTVQRIAVKHGITLPGESARPPRRKLVVPQVRWERNRVWMWEASEFPTTGRVAYALVDVVTRYWLGYVLSSEQSWVQLQLLYASALEEQRLRGGVEPVGEDGPILIGWEAAEPAGPTHTAQVESLFGHLRIEWPQLNLPTDPDTLDQELARVRGEYNTVRLDAAIGYVTPEDEHEGRGPQIRDERDAGLRRARAERIRQNRGLAG
jgi:putative transposase